MGDRQNVCPDSGIVQSPPKTPIPQPPLLGNSSSSLRVQRREAEQLFLSSMKRPGEAVPRAGLVRICASEMCKDLPKTTRDEG